MTEREFQSLLDLADALPEPERVAVTEHIDKIIEAETAAALAVGEALGEILRIVHEQPNPSFAELWDAAAPAWLEGLGEAPFVAISSRYPSPRTFTAPS